MELETSNNIENFFPGERVLEQFIRVSVAIF